VSIATRLTDPDVAVRAQAAGELAAAANAIADAARAVRDVNASEMLRNGVRPADVGRMISVTRAQMARFKASSTALNRREIADGAAEVEQALAGLMAVIDLNHPAPA
jgi:hypothetical protein